MKKYLLPFAVASVVLLQACNDTTTAPEAVEAASTPTLENSEERLSYGVAYGLGQRVAADQFEVNVDAFMLGLTDALEGKEARLSPEEMQAELQAYQEKAKAEAEAELAAASDANKAAGEAFLAENAEAEGVVVTESGLQYKVIEAGEGAKPGPDDVVEVHYRGTLIDGTEFDSSYARGETVSFGVTQVIPGWTEALQLMNVGSKWNLFIPSDLAYGAGGAGQMIGPNSTLQFEVELISIVEPEEAPAAD